MNLLEFVDLETARASRGVRIVASGVIPSPWSEAAKEIFHIKEIPVKVVRFRRDEAAFRNWTGASNVPVVFYDDEPPRTGWAEILDLSERLGGTRSLVSSEAEARVRLYGLAHELAGENGLGWSARLLMIDGGLTSNGERGFPLPVARYLASKYGYAPERVRAAHARILEIAELFDHQLAQSHASGHSYLVGPEVSALDIYLATFLTPAAAISEADCPAMRQEVSRAFAHLYAEVGEALPPALIAHRALMFERHLRHPILI